MPPRGANPLSSALVTRGPWHHVLAGPERAGLEALLPAYLAGRRWFGAKARSIAAARIRDAVPLGASGDAPWLVLVDVECEQGGRETYVVPLAWSEAPPGMAAAVAPLSAGGRRGVLHAAEHDAAFARGLLADIAAGARRPGGRGVLVASATAALPAGAADEPPAPALLSAEQSNTSVRFGDRFILKLFRRTAPGVNPDLEVGAYLTIDAGYRHTPPALGSVEYRPEAGEPLAVAFLQGFVQSRGDAWQLALEELASYLARVARAGRSPEVQPSSPAQRAAARELAGEFPKLAALLGRRTAQLHLALAARPDLPAFAPEPFTVERQALLHAALARQAETSMSLLAQRLDALPDAIRPLAASVLARRDAVSERTAWLLRRPIAATCIRTHGDYHLGQVLWTGTDFVVIDFEGEPARPLAERRVKGSALRDVAGMLRSFHYASRAGASAQARGPLAEAEPWLRAWYRAVADEYVRAYLEETGGAPFLPGDEETRRALLSVHLLEKALYELAYELNNRPDWVALPLEGLAELLGAA